MIPAPPMSGGAFFLRSPQMHGRPVPQRTKHKITTGVWNNGPDRKFGLTRDAMDVLMIEEKKEQSGSEQDHSEC
jgi:hypothetical protein